MSSHELWPCTEKLYKDLRTTNYNWQKTSLSNKNKIMRASKSGNLGQRCEPLQEENWQADRQVALKCTTVIEKPQNKTLECSVRIYSVVQSNYTIKWYCQV